ncbi:Olfactory receptor 14I1 [Manis javanica]|nr:Olfactory receptor 14I1 [Manis javanica]
MALCTMDKMEQLSSQEFLDTRSILAGMDNLTTITEFLLMDISSSQELQVLQGPIANKASIENLLTAVLYTMVPLS